MQDQVNATLTPLKRLPWNKGKLTGAKPPLGPKHVWSIRTKLQIEGRARDLAMFNLAIDSKLRGCDVVAIRVEDVAASGYTADRATLRQKKTGRPVRFELSEQTRQAVDDYLKVANKRPGEFLFSGRRGVERSMTTRQCAPRFRVDRQRWAGPKAKAVIYDILFTTSAQTMTIIAADPKHLGARIGITSVLHTWGSALTHHPHVHMIVPGGGISIDGTRWVPCRPDFILPVKVLSCLFRGLFLAKLVTAHRAGRLKFFGVHARLDNIKAFKAYLAPLRKIDWVVYAKLPFGGPRAVLAYLSRYTHRVAISNRRLIAADHTGVSFRWKNYRIEGSDRYQTMTLSTHEFIRRFLMHVLPGGFHRIRHYGLLASGCRAANIARARELLAVPVRCEQQDTSEAPAADEPRMLPRPCPCCGGRMFIIETFARGSEPKHRPTPAPAAIRIDTS